MRTLCDACESAPAIVFCSADEAALCRACDETVHMCNKLANRHVRVGLASPGDVPRCDICENASAFFYCEIDGIALCLQCDMIVHIGGKRTHPRYLLLRQKVEFPEDANIFDASASQTIDEAAENRRQNPALTLTLGDNQQNRGVAPADNQQNRGVAPAPMAEPKSDGHARRGYNMIDLNRKPCRIHEQTSNNKY